MPAPATSFTNLTVTGTQTVTGAQTFTGAATFSSTVALNGDATLATTKKLILRDAGLFIHSSADGKILISADGASTDDITLSGTVTLDDDLITPTNKKIQFRDAGLFIHSNADGKLTISSDGAGADDIILAGTVTANDNLTMAAAKTINCDADMLLVGSVIVPQTFLVTFNIPGGAAAADYDGSIPIPVACELVSVNERHQTAGSDGGAVTVMATKVPSGTAKASGTDMLSAGISLKGTADTNAAGSLHATAANYQLAAGDAVALVTTGTLTAVDGVTVTMELKRI